MSSLILKMRVKVLLRVISNVFAHLFSCCDPTERLEEEAKNLNIVECRDDLFN